jgi:hypothetical protein
MASGASSMFNMLKAGTIHWGNVPESPKAPSPHRPSSGQTSEIQRLHGRKGRQAHYTRKAILEKEKEEDRRRFWLLHHPGAAEANWNTREKKRKTRKEILRGMRKADKKRRA